jgi:hypothetical protein
VKPPTEKIPQKKANVAIVTGFRLTGHSADHNMYMQLSRMYYAKRHGYKTVFYSSNQFVKYFHPDLFKVRTSTSVRP